MSVPMVYRGYEIERRVIGHSYARNGNLGNPTERVRWFTPGVGWSPTLRAAKELIDETIALSAAQS